ncbi:MAG: vWA domain-containing protein, partial [Sciscionella sp.]
PDDGWPDGDGPDGGPAGGASRPAPDGAAQPEGASTTDPTEDHSRGVSPDPAFRARMLQVPGIGEGAPGRRSRARTTAGRQVRSSISEGRGIHLLGTLLAAAPHQRNRRAADRPGLALRGGDLRRVVREGKESNLVLFVVDASGSMAARARMNAVTGAVVSLLRDAYQRRDKVAVVTFRRGAAALTLPPTNSVDAAVKRLRDLRTGGRTPLAAGLLQARRTLTVERVRDPQRRALLVLLTDGRATSGSGGDPVLDARRAGRALAADGVAGVVVDCETGPVRLGLAGELAEVLGARCLQLAQLSADEVAGVVRANRAA